MLHRTLPAVPVDHFADNHIHSKYCLHARGEMREYVVAAIDAGLREITFLEHMEEGIVAARRSWLNEEDFDSYWQDAEALRNEYQTKISIKIGVEVGYNPNCIELLRKRINKRPWDRVGLSYHFFAVKDEPHINLLSRAPEHSIRVRQRSPHQIAAHYLQALYEAVHALPINSLCHLDAALRHIPEISLWKHHRQGVENLLQAMKNNNVSLEINTSGFDYRSECFPANAICMRAHELGIPFILGSDAHKPKDVARYFPRR